PPGFVGEAVGLPGGGVGLPSPPLTFTLIGAVLFFGLRSSTALDTSADPSVTFADRILSWKIPVPVCPTGNVPSSHRYSLPGVVALHDLSTLVNSGPAGPTSFTLVCGASEGPSFFTVSLTWTVSPTLPRASVTLTPRSAWFFPVNTENGTLLSVGSTSFGPFVVALIALAASAAGTTVAASVSAASALTSGGGASPSRGPRPVTRA